MTTADETAAPAPARGAFIPPATMRPEIVGRRWVVSSGHPLATEAAMRVLAAGGNAIDAGVAAGICINVVQPDWTNFGGVAPIILHTRDGGTVSIAGLGHWPRETDADWLRSTFHGELPVGVLRTVVPAAPAAWLLALERYGTLPLSAVLGPALDLAETGFPVYPMLAAALANFGEVFQQWPSSVAVYWPQGRPPVTGEWLRQPDLARTFRRLIEAEAGASGSRAERIRAARDRFYRGDIAAEIASFVRAEGGWLSREDMAAFEPEVERPPSIRLGDWEVFACGPWCQGPALLQAANILADDDLRALGHNSADYIHLIAESLNLAFADREAFYGDPRQVEVPLAGLLSRDYARARRATLDMRRAFGRLPDPGDPWRYQGGAARPAPASPAPRAGLRSADTSYLCVIDADGNAFSATPSDVLTWAPVVPGLGLVASGRGVQSRLDPSHPSTIAPGRRPRLTPNPGLARRNDGSLVAFGTPGGDVQIQAMLQTFLNHTLWGQSAQAAVEQPRFASLSHPNSFYPHAYTPGLLRLEGRYPEAVLADLAARGHTVQPWQPWDPEAGSICLTARQPGEPWPSLRAGADPRRVAYAAGW